MRHLAGFAAILQVDGYTGYNALADPARPGGPVTFAPIADQLLARVAMLYAVEDAIRGLPSSQRQAVRGPHPLACRERATRGLPWIEQQS